MRKDYIMKMIEDFVRIIAKVILNRETKNYELAKDELNNLSMLVSGLGIEHLKSLGKDGIIYVFSKNRETEIEKVYCSARILKEDGLIHEAEGNTEESLKSFRLSAELFELVSTKDFSNKNLDEKEESLKELEFLKNKLTEKHIAG